MKHSHTLSLPPSVHPICCCDLLQTPSVHINTLFVWPAHIPNLFQSEVWPFLPFKWNTQMSFLFITSSLHCRAIVCMCVCVCADAHTSFCWHMVMLMPGKSIQVTMQTHSYTVVCSSLFVELTFTITSSCLILNLTSFNLIIFIVVLSLV